MKELAHRTDMAESSLYQNFKTVTSMLLHQFQKAYAWKVLEALIGVVMLCLAFMV